ncbi:MAG: thioredoxin-dependent thiol peroxidase [Rhodothermales bacterium]
MSTMPEAGQQAPVFCGSTQDGETLCLNDYRGRKVALYFYPKDDTPGCTKQACNLRDGYQELLDAGIAVIGVSPDEVASHQRFADKYELPFPLVADPERKVLDLYGTWGEKNRYGRIVMGVKRTTFLIDEEGLIRHVFKRPKVAEHTEEVLDKFKSVRA